MHTIPNLFGRACPDKAGPILKHTRGIDARNIVKVVFKCPSHHIIFKCGFYSGALAALYRWNTLIFIDSYPHFDAGRLQVNTVNADPFQYIFPLALVCISLSRGPWMHSKSRFSLTRISLASVTTIVSTTNALLKT